MIEKMLVSMVAGLLGLVPAILQWFTERGKAKNRHNQLVKLSNELEFIEKWIKIKNDCTGDDTKENAALLINVQNDMVRILDDYRLIKQKESQARIEGAKIPAFRRMFLLFTPLSPKGWLIHSAFYVLIIFAVSIIISDFQHPTYDPETGANEFTDLLIGLVILFCPIFIFLQWVGVRDWNEEMAELKSIEKTELS